MLFCFSLLIRFQGSNLSMETQKGKMGNQSFCRALQLLTISQSRNVD